MADTRQRQCPFLRRHLRARSLWNRSHLCYYFHLFRIISRRMSKSPRVRCACVCRRRWCIPRIIFCASFRWWLCRWKIFRCDLGTSTSCHGYNDRDDAPVVAWTRRTNKNMNWCLPIRNCVAVSNRAELKLETRLWLLLLLFEQQEKGVQQPLTRFGWHTEQSNNQQQPARDEQKKKKLRIVKCVNGWCGAVLLLVRCIPRRIKQTGSCWLI